MKTLFLFLSFIILSLYSIKAQVIENSAYIVVKNIVDKLKNSQFPANSKIAVLMFPGRDEFNDTLKTRLGIQISSAIANKLNIALQDDKKLSKMNYIILIPDNFNNLTMKSAFKYFVPPSNSNEENDFYTSFYKNKKPDYYLSGTYFIDNGFSKLKIYDIKIESDPYNLKTKQILAVEGSENVITSDEKRTIMNFHTPTIEETASNLVYLLQRKIKKIDKTVKLEYFLYDNKPVGSIFSREITRLLENDIVQEKLFPVTTKNVNEALNEKVFWEYTLKGVYWDGGNMIKISATLSSKDSTIATATVSIPKIYLEENHIEFKPENYEQFMKNDEVLREGNTIISPSLNIELLTNKGKDNLIFTKGELLKLFIKSNKPCYVRILYYLADGQLVLMVDNFKIDQDKAGKYVKIDQEFECDKPFGIETMVIQAQTTLLDPLNVTSKDGYQYVDNSLSEALETGRRGFKLKKEMTEKRIQYTTMEK